MPSTDLISLLGVHVLLAATVTLYFRIYFARSVYVDCENYVGEYTRQEHSVWAAVRSLCSTAHIPLPTPRPGGMNREALRQFVYECDELGEPQRCWRDQCSGHWKVPRYVPSLTQDAALRRLWHMPLLF